MNYAIILAAGKGTRMKSNKPKVLHKILDKTMIEQLIDTCRKAGADKIICVLGYKSEEVIKVIEYNSDYVIQEPQLGTAHAVSMCSELKDMVGKTLVINGDVPCIKEETLRSLYDNLQDNKMLVLTTILKDGKHYGRVVKENDEIVKIVEYKDTSDKEREIKEINTGIYVFDNEVLFKGLEKVNNNNAQNEYYLTDLVEIIRNMNYKVKSVVCDDNDEVSGVNDRIELALLNKYMAKRINEEHMRNGVTIIDPDNTYIGSDVIIGSDSIIYPNVTIFGKSILENNTTIKSNSYLFNAFIGENTIVDSSVIKDSIVKRDCEVGPFAHLRMNSVVEPKNRIGNFVEFKNTHFGYNSRCAHLTYLGDCDVGDNVNIGCGVVSVNYDGKNKYRTTIKNGAFIGSNANLIAPVTIGENALVAAGSTIYMDVDDGDMGIARSRQENKLGYGEKYKNK